MTEDLFVDEKRGGDDRRSRLVQNAAGVGPLTEQWEFQCMADQLTPFHVAVQVRDIAEARDFYGNQMGLAEGRSSECWIDFNMFGHQFVTHLNPALGKDGRVSHIANPVDNHGVPVPHCGVVMAFEDWQKFADRVRGFITEFIIEPYIRFAGEPGEQGTMFFCDPSGNALEFKGFKDIERDLFKK